MDLLGPHLPGRWPAASPEKYARRAQYFLVASYRVFTQEEFDTAVVNADFAKKKARVVHFEDEAAWQPEGSSEEGVAEAAGGLGIFPEGEGSEGGRVMCFARFLETKSIKQTVPELFLLEQERWSLKPASH